MRPTTMLYRNLMAMDTEEMIRAHPLDGVVLLGNCDKTTPAQMMGAASANVPAIILTGGPHLSGRFRGESLGACSDGRQIVETVQKAIRPSDVLTPRAFENAIRLMMALGGSTNAVIHLMAIAGRRGIQLPLELFDRMSRETPFITNLRPSGLFHMEQLFDAGGVPAVMKELARGGLLHLNERSVTGRTIGEQLELVPPLGSGAATGTGWCGP